MTPSALPRLLIGSQRTGQAPVLTDRALTGCTISRGRQAPPRINRWHRTRLHPTITTENRNLTNASTPITRRISTSSGVPAGTAWSSTLLVEVYVMAFIRSAADDPLGAVVIPARLLRRGLGRGCECCCAPPHPPHSFRCGRGRTRGGTVRRLKKGGCRISFTLRPALLPSRNGAMTPFPMSAGVAAHPKVGASLSVVAIPAGPRRRGGPPAREGGGHRGSPVPRPRFTRSAPTMPSHQSAVSTLIREVLADPDLAHDEVFRRLLQAGLQDLVDAEAAAVIGAQRHVAHAASHQQAQRQAPQDGGHHRRRGRAGHPRASDRIVLPVPAPPPPAGGQGPDAP